MKPKRRSEASKAFNKEQQEYREWVANGGPERVDKSKCYLCQESAITHEVTSSNGTFGVCEPCSKAIAFRAEQEFRVKQKLFQSDIFRMTLGMPLPQRTVTIKKIS